ncbi:MAG TPA: transcriptional regulator [Rhodanobacteraceae bacterium]|nr:transcriptional regulator [Rhodanobacteraceae bacterium]
MGASIHRFGHFRLTIAQRELCRDGEPVPLSPRAFDCIAYLVEHRERAIGKDELIAAIWGRVNVSDTQLGQTVLRARRAVDDDGQTQHSIRTIPRFGYRWVAPVSEATEDVAAVQITAQHDATAEGTDMPATAVPPTAVPAPTPTAAPVDRPRLSRKRRRAIAGAVGLLSVCIGAALVLVAAAWFRHRPASGNWSAATFVVLPMRVDAQPDSAWLRLGAMDLVAERLRSGGLRVSPSESIVALLQSTSARAPEAEAHALRHALPQAVIVRGRIAATANGWSVHLQARAADATTLDADDADGDVLRATRAAADRLLARLGRAHPRQTRAAPGLQERMQRAQAALLANDLDSARAILIGDPELAHSEPQLGYQLVRVDFRAGRYARAENAATALLGEPAARDPLFRARLFNARGAVRIRRDDYSGAQDDFDRAVQLLDSGQHAAELGQALTGRGVTRAERHDFAGGLSDLGKARVQLEKAGDDLAIARVDADLGALEMYRDRSDAALGYLDSAAAKFEMYGAINELLETLYSMVSAELAQLRPHAALAASDRSWALRDRASDPTQRLNLTLDRVEVFLALGRLHESAALLAALPSDPSGANPYSARRLHDLRARSALAASDPATAAIEARHALDLPPAGDGGEQQATIAWLYQRAELAARPADPAVRPARHWLYGDGASAQAPVFAVQALAEAEWARHQGRSDEAEQRFRQALALAEKRGVPADIAQVAEAYGPWLLERDRRDAAGAVIGRVSPWATRDYGCAVLQVRLYGALGQPGPWAEAVEQATTLAGERTLPAALLRSPVPSAVP